MSGFLHLRHKAKSPPPPQTLVVVLYPAVCRSRLAEGVRKRCSSFKPLKSCLASLTSSALHVFLGCFIFFSLV